jgi:hypothetical protein
MYLHYTELLISETEDVFNAYYAANTVQLEQADWTNCDTNCREEGEPSRSSVFLDS